MSQKVLRVVLESGINGELAQSVRDAIETLRGIDEVSLEQEPMTWGELLEELKGMDRSVLLGEAIVVTENCEVIKVRTSVTKVAEADDLGVGAGLLCLRQGE